MGYYVEVIEYDTDKVVRRFGPHPQRKAEKIDDGLQHNLNHDRFLTRIVNEEIVRAESIGEN